MKITGAEFQEWYDNHFPDGFYHDDYFLEHFTDEGDLVDVTADYDSDELGSVFWEGDPNQDPTRGCGYSVTQCIRKWRKTRDCFILRVVGPKAQEEDLRRELKAKGYKVQ